MRARTLSRILSILWLASAAQVVGAGGDPNLRSAVTGEDAGRAAIGAHRELETVLRLVPDRRHGKAVFGVCERCHAAGASALPKGWVPRITGQHVRFIAKELVDYRHGLRWDLRMEIVAGRHTLESDQDISDVASYVATLAPSQTGSKGRGGDLDQGRAVYRAKCTTCHGPAGEGSNARLVPRLAGQDYDYLLRQLHDAVDGRRPNMTSPHAQLLRHFDAAQLEGVADYLSRLMPQGVTASLVR